LFDPVTQRITIEAAGIFESSCDEAKLGASALGYLNSNRASLSFVAPIANQSDNPFLRFADRVAAVLGLNPRV
jgi:hypothetical protein